MQLSIADRLAFPAGRAPGVDPAHPASRGLLGSFMPAGSTQAINLRNGKYGAVSGNFAGASASGIHGVVGKWSTGKCTDNTNHTVFANSLPSTTQSPTMTFAGIGVWDGSNVGFNSIIGTSLNGGGESGGSFFGCGNNSGQALVVSHWAVGNYWSSILLTANVPYFVAVSFDAGLMDFIAVNLLTGAVSTDFGLATTSPAAPVDRALIVYNAFYGGAAWSGPVAATMASQARLTRTQLLKWAEDPWAFWYPRFEPEFEVGSLAAAALAALSRIVARGRGGVTGAAPIAARAGAQVKARSTLAGSVALAGRSIVETMARASIAGASALAGRVAVAVKARSTIAGSVALAGRTIIETMARAIPPGAIALFARAAVSVAARAAGPLASTALAGRTVLRASGRVVPPGAIALVAAAFARLTGRAQAAGATTLSARSRTQARSTLTLTPVAGLQATSRVSARARGGLSASAALAALSARAAIRSAARAILTRLGVPFTASPRNVMPPALPRTVQVAGENRTVIAVDDGRSAEPGSS